MTFDGPRPAGPEDLGPLLDMINYVFRTHPASASGGRLPPSMGWNYTHIYRPSNLDNIRVVSHHSNVVCSIGIYDTISKTPRGLVNVSGINAVGTHPDYRRYGLATATLHACHQRMQETGRHVALLSTGIHNWYRKLGWERAGSQYTFTVDRRNIAFLPSVDGLDITEDWRPHTEAMRALQSNAAVGAARDAATFAMLAERKGSRFFVARRGGEVVAYAGVSGSSVRDYGGAARDVAALLGPVMVAVDKPDARTTDRAITGGHVELSVITPATDGLANLLLEAGFPHSLGYMGLLKLLDPAGLLAAQGIQDVTVKSLGADGPYMERWQVQHGGVTLDLNECELVKLFFGPERWPDFAPGIFPLSLWVWPFDRV